VPGTEVATVKRYRVVLERDESGAWVATVPAVPGCHSYGRSLVEARRRVRKALALWVDDAGVAELADDVRIPDEVAAAVRRSRGARETLATARDAAGAATVDAAHRLVDELGLGVRDAAYLLGLSHQRVQQLLRSP
jgi:predicted RNase H-like HicB family nuclease